MNTLKAISILWMLLIFFVIVFKMLPMASLSMGGIAAIISCCIAWFIVGVLPVKIIKLGVSMFK
jgi:hypothetical protein